MTRCLYWDDKLSIDAAAARLRENELVIGATDTVFGLLAPLTCEGYDALNRVKERKGKPYLVLVGDAKKAQKFAEIPKKLQIEKLIGAWPAPLTLIFNAKKNLPSYLVSDQGTIALRVPDHDGLRQLLVRFDGLFSTSANKSGEPIPSSTTEINPVLVQDMPFVLCNPGQEKKGIIPSTIVDCTVDPIQVIRQGKYVV